MSKNHGGEDEIEHAVDGSENGHADLGVSRLFEKGRDQQCEIGDGLDDGDSPKVREHAVLSSTTVASPFVTSVSAAHV